MSLDSSVSQPVVPSGLPCWVEHASVDEGRVQEFYAGLFGWDLKVKPDPSTVTGRYTIASLGGISVAGLYRAAAGQPLGWTIHVAVSNAVNTAEWIEHLGGRLTLGPIRIPDRGSIVHALDPTGAPIVFWQPGDSYEFAAGEPGTLAGADLNTHDGAGSDHFFCKLFNYSNHQLGDTHNLDYAEWRLDHQPVLYRYVMGPEYRADTPPHWMIYFAVDPGRGTDATAGHALMLGGTVVVQPYDTPFGRTAVLADPDGAVFSIIDHTLIAEDLGRAEVDDPYDD
jgi:predicted enzyme related to lactoylglutathione lyase